MEKAATAVFTRESLRAELPHGHGDDQHEEDQIQVLCLEGVRATSTKAAQKTAEPTRHRDERRGGHLRAESQSQTEIGAREPHCVAEAVASSTEAADRGHGDCVR